MRWLAGAALLFPLACSVAEDAPVATTRQAIIQGSTSPPRQDAVVALLLLQDGAPYSTCTAALLAPNLLLTARHCVSQTEPTIDCDSEGRQVGGGPIGPDRAPSDLGVVVGTDMEPKKPSFAAYGREIIHDGSPVLCNHDLALVVLDRSLHDARIVEPRFDQSVTAGEEIAAVGWGLVEGSKEPSQRRVRTGIRVLDVGPVGGVLPAGASEFLVGESTCLGDSGGPALADDDRYVVGVVSRGGNPGEAAPFYDPALGCIGEKTRGVYTAVTPFRALIERALVRSSETAGGVRPRAWEPSPPASSSESGGGCSVARRR